MNPDSRFSASLVLSLALTMPALLSAFRGDIDVVTAGTRYLVAFAAVWICVGVIGRMYNNYVADLEVAKETDAPAVTSRRSDDAKQAALETQSTDGSEDDDVSDDADAESADAT